METAQEILSFFSGAPGYILFFTLVTACGCGFPFNSDITLIAGAVLSANGTFEISWMMALALTGLLAGDSICFFAARKWGMRLARTRPLRGILNESRMEKARSAYLEHGDKILFTARFIPLIRSAFFFSAGTFGVSARSFYGMNGLATLIYVPTLMLSSYFLSRNIDVVISSLKGVQLAVVIVAIGAVAWRFLFSRR